MARHKRRSARSKERLPGCPESMQALASGTRQEIVDVLTSGGPATAAELGQLLGRRPDALYFHLNILEQAKLVVRCKQYTDGGRASTVFSVQAPIKLDYKSGSRQELARVVSHAIRLAQREFEHECLAERPVGSKRRRRLRGGRVMGWVSAQELERINTLMDELREILLSGRPGPGRKAMALGFLLAPAGCGDRRRAPQKTREDELE